MMSNNSKSNSNNKFGETTTLNKLRDMPDQKKTVLALALEEALKTKSRSN